MRGYVEFLEECELWGDEPTDEAFANSVSEMLEPEVENEQ